MKLALLLALFFGLPAGAQVVNPPIGGGGSGCIPAGTGIQKGNGSGGCATATSADVTPILPAFTGDATSTAGTSALTLSTVNSTPGTVGSTTTVPVITTDGKGRVTAVSTATITAGGITALTGDVTASGPGSAASNLATVNSTPGTVGSSTVVPVITTDGKGRVTAVSSATIASGGGANFPSSGTPCVPQATSTTASTCATPAQLQAQSTDTTIPSAIYYVTGTVSQTCPTGQANYVIDCYNTTSSFLQRTVGATAPYTPIDTIINGNGMAVTNTGHSATIALPATGTAGTYGSASTVPVLTTDAYGRITGVTNTTISAPAPTDAAYTVAGNPTGSPASRAATANPVTTTSSTYAATGTSAIGMAATGVTTCQGATTTGCDTWITRTAAKTVAVGSTATGTDASLVFGTVATSVESVTFSATPTLSATTGFSRVALSGNITSFTLAAGVAGQQKCINFAHDATTTAYTVTPPSNVKGLGTPGSAASGRNVQCWYYSAIDSQWLAIGAMVTNQ